jgi:hypothetical protein
MQNLREAIAGYRQRLMREGHEGKRNSLLEVLTVCNRRPCHEQHVAFGMGCLPYTAFTIA